MLSRAQRLSTSDFAVVFEKSQVLRHPLFQLRVLRRQGNAVGTNQNKRQSGARAAFVAPKKLGKAVLRNQIRRRVRERYRLLHKICQAPEVLAYCDLIWMIRPAAQQASLQEIDDALRELLNRAARFVEKNG